MTISGRTNEMSYRDQIIVDIFGKTHNENNKCIKLAIYKILFVTIDFSTSPLINVWKFANLLLSKI